VTAAPAREICRDEDEWERGRRCLSDLALPATQQVADWQDKSPSLQPT
jgi:hypothetical protein